METHRELQQRRRLARKRTTDWCHHPWSTQQHWYVQTAEGAVQVGVLVCRSE